ncbi:MAG: RdgB/HAM1 family non-canonical purine NTP pyrophosphatase [Spirochaetia bacterium]|nr:RdgB/HAM1 family non-canonical purine NTP pyrophosphatase [Spirochaetia bacterium]
MDIVVATGNKNKIREFSQIMPEHRFFTPADLNIEFDFEETGSTYAENALGKAMYIYKKIGKPVIGEDSGLSVPALNGEPGIYSARYGAVNGVKLADDVRNQYLLDKMKDIKDRRAFFVCCMVLVLGEYRYYVIQETMDGLVTLKPEGSGGFGYDPVFYHEGAGKTAGEMTPEEKNSISHRGRACSKMKLLIQALAGEMK